MRIGIGYDVHALVEDRDLIIGGEKIPYKKGLLGHSDADVLVHAIEDGILGALALGDIGKIFPDTDPKYKDASSIEMMKVVAQMMSSEGYKIGNVDATIIAEKPKLAPYIKNIRKNIALALQSKVEDISIKATTSEKMGYEGREEGMTAVAVVLLKRIED